MDNKRQRLELYRTFLILDWISFLEKFMKIIRFHRLFEDDFRDFRRFIYKKLSYY